MKAYLDTSALIRAARLGCVPKGVTRSHSLAEFYCVFTGPGIVVQRDGQMVKMTLSPRDAARVARKTFSRMKYHDLAPSAALTALEAAASENVIGKNIHDWMHCMAAKEVQAETIVTLNTRHFSAMTDLELTAPADYLASEDMA